MNAVSHPLCPTKHSMKRRAPWHDYRSPGTYMLTLVVEGRRALLGRLEYGSRLSHNMAENGKPSRPYVALSPLGEAILKEVIGKVSHHHPQVEVWRICIMPDHIHLIVHVNATLPEGKGLGRVVNGIKQGSNKAYKAIILGHGIPEDGTQGENMRQAGLPVPGHTMPRLFEPGYNDRLLFDGAQLERWKRYLDDNPRRLAVKRLHPELFTVKRGMDIGGRSCQIIGNHFLLDIPDKVAVIYHRRYAEAEFRQLRDEWMACGERGGVLVSAAIHPNEKEVMREAMDCGYRMILLRENGFSEYYKPSGEAFDACSRGQLLQVSPWEYHVEQKTISRTQCLTLNELAEAIASTSSFTSSGP